MNFQMEISANGHIGPSLASHRDGCVPPRPLFEAAFKSDGWVPSPRASMNDEYVDTEGVPRS
jgi:hypothetical protein